MCESWQVSWVPYHLTTIHPPGYSFCCGSQKQEGTLFSFSLIPSFGWASLLNWNNWMNCNRQNILLGFTVFFFNSFWRPRKSRKKKTSSWPFSSWHSAVDTHLPVQAHLLLCVETKKKIHMWYLIVPLQKWNSISWVGGRCHSCFRFYPSRFCSPYQ